MTQHNAPNDRAAQVPRHERERQAQIMCQLRTGSSSQAAAARQYGIPRTTISSWMARCEDLDADQQLIEFFTSPVGLLLLHRIVCAAHFVFGLVGLGSCRLISLFLQLSGLAPFVASSKTVCNDRHRFMLELTNQFAQQQQQRLIPLLRADLGTTERKITICCDETFHPQTCLVAIEPVSNFIFVERYANDRKASTWILDARAALKDFPVRVSQLVADGAEALAALARHFDAHLSPDLMHLLQPLSRKVLGPAARKVKASQAEPLDERVLQAQQQDLETLQKAVEEVKAAYHPVELQTGQTTAVATARLEAAFEAVRQAVERLGLSDSAHDAVGASAKQVEQMIVTLGRAQRMRKSLLSGLDEEVRAAVESGARGAYLRKMARSASAQEGHRLVALAQTVESGQVMSREVERHVADIMRIFERSSSCVEGRNGYLALCHHARHRLSEAHLKALTTVHNYVLRRPDGTTAAHRFFGHEHDNLFEFLLEQMPLPAWPRTGKRPAPMLS